MAERINKTANLRQNFTRFATNTVFALAQMRTMGPVAGVKVAEVQQAPKSHASQKYDTNVQAGVDVQQNVKGRNGARQGYDGRVVVETFTAETTVSRRKNETTVVRREVTYTSEKSERRRNKHGNVYDSQDGGNGYHYLGDAQTAIGFLDYLGVDTTEILADIADTQQDFEGITPDGKIGTVKFAEAVGTALMKDGGADRLYEKVQALPAGEKEKLADLKATALDKFGMGALRDEIVSSDTVSMADVRDFSDRLNHLTNQAVKQSWDEATIVDNLKPLLADVNNTSADGAYSLLALTSLMARGEKKGSKLNKRKMVVVFCALALLLASCGGAAPAPTQDVDPTATQINTVTAPQVTSTPMPEATSAPIDAVCGKSPGAELFGGGYNAGKAVPVLSEQGFTSVYGDRTAATAEGQKAQQYQLEVTQEVARELHEVIKSNPSIDKAVIPQYVSVDDVNREIGTLRQSENLDPNAVPFTIVNYSTTEAINGENTLLVSVHAGEAGRDIALWKGSKLIQREDGSFAIDGTLYVLTTDSEGQSILYAPPAQRIDGRADIAIVDGCSPVIVRVNGNDVLALMNPDFNLPMLQDANPDLLWLEKSELVESGGPVVDQQPPQEVFDHFQQMGINVVNENGAGGGGWNLLFNGVEIPDAVIDQTGLIITTNEGTISLSPEVIMDNVEVIDGAVRINDAAGNHLAVYDPSFVTEKWGGHWITKDEGVKERYDGVPEAWVQVSTQAELDEAAKLGKLLSREFPEGTYLPPLDKLYVNYDEDNSKTGEYSARYPFGTRSDFRNNLPFMFVNHILLLPNESEGREYYACILQQAVYNSDGSKGILNFTSSGDTADECIGAVGGMQVGIDHYENGDYILPIYDPGRGVLNRSGWARYMVDSLKSQGLMSNSGVLDAKIKQYVITWFSTGIVPEELEKMYSWGVTRAFEKWD